MLCSGDLWVTTTLLAHSLNDYSADLPGPSQSAFLQVRHLVLRLGNCSTANQDHVIADGQSGSAHTVGMSL